MSLPLVIALNVVLDLALLGGLAMLMSRPAKLRAHTASSEGRLVHLRANRERRGERTAA